MVWQCSVTSWGQSSARRTWTSGWLWRGSRGHAPWAKWRQELKKSTLSLFPPLQRDRYVSVCLLCNWSDVWSCDISTSRLQVNVDSSVRESTSQSLRLGVHPASFQLAQDQVFGLMETDSYPRFLRSRFYVQLANQGSATVLANQSAARSVPVSQWVMGASDPYFDSICLFLVKLKMFKTQSLTFISSSEALCGGSFIFYLYHNSAIVVVLKKS